MTDEVVSIEFTIHELLILRECANLVGRRSSLSEIFEEEDDAWCDQHDDDDEDQERRPTVTLAHKLAIYAFPDDDESVVATIRERRRQ